MYNTLLYIGMAFLLSGFVLFIMSEIMTAHYDRKLYQLQQKEANDTKNTQSN